MPPVPFLPTTPGAPGGVGAGGFPLGGMMGGGAVPGGPYPDAQGAGPESGMDNTARLALSALDQLAPREASGEASLERVKKALDLAQKLIVTALPQVSQWNAKMAKDLHVIGRQLADARINLSKEEEPGPPPEELIAGIGATGVPSRYL